MNMFKPLMKAMPATELYIYIYSFWDGSGIKIWIFITIKWYQNVLGLLIYKYNMLSYNIPDSDKEINILFS